MAMITFKELGILLKSSVVLIDDLSLTGTQSLRHVARTLYQPWQVSVTQILQHKPPSKLIKNSQISEEQF